MKSNRKRRSRAIPLDSMQTAVAIFAVATDMTPRYLPSSKATRKVRTATLNVNRRHER